MSVSWNEGKDRWEYHYEIGGKNFSFFIEKAVMDAQHQAARLIDQFMGSAITTCKESGDAN